MSDINLHTQFPENGLLQLLELLANHFKMGAGQFDFKIFARLPMASYVAYLYSSLSVG